MNRVESLEQHCPDSQTRLLVRSACRAALTGGSILRELYSRPHRITMKGEIDLVTEADVASETAIVASLNEDTPGLPILAEESAGDRIRETEDRVWIVDPLDGTTNYAHGFPLFAVSVALAEKGRPMIGAVYCPLQDELFCAWKEGGAWLNSTRISVTATDFLIQALVGTGFPYDIRRRLDEVLDQVRAILPKVRDIRRGGAAAVDLAYVACGRLDGFWERDLKPWDIAAGWLLVEEAGGRVSDFSGADCSLFGDQILAANPALHPLLVRELT